MTTGGPAHGHFSEGGVVPIVLDDFTKPVVVALACERSARTDRVPASEQELPQAAGIVPLGL